MCWPGKRLVPRARGNDWCSLCVCGHLCKETEAKYKAENEYYRWGPEVFVSHQGLEGQARLLSLILVCILAYVEPSKLGLRESDALLRRGCLFHEFTGRASPRRQCSAHECQSEPQSGELAVKVVLDRVVERRKRGREKLVEGQGMYRCSLVSSWRRRRVFCLPTLRLLHPRTNKHDGHERASSFMIYLQYVERPTPFSETAVDPSNGRIRTADSSDGTRPRRNRSIRGSPRPHKCRGFPGSRQSVEKHEKSFVVYKKNIHCKPRGLRWQDILVLTGSNPKSGTMDPSRFSASTQSTHRHPTEPRHTFLGGGRSVDQPATH